MFDELTPAAPAPKDRPLAASAPPPPAPRPAQSRPGAEPQDMLAGVDRGGPPRPAAPSPTASPAGTPPSGFPPELLGSDRSVPWARVAVGAAVLAVLAGVGYGLTGFLGRRSAVPAATPSPADATAPNLQNQVDWSAPSTDTDGDGLSDEEESTLGTDSKNVDTDGDGLFDGEEAKVWKTNPLQADTDGDSFQDGQEVRGGYNPNGPGKIITVPETPPQP